MKNLIIDAFAGGGGASVGIEMALGRPVDIAINHDPDAILMHKTNHPDTLHLTEDIFKVNLKKYVKGQHVALMWASPDCTSHSKAKGGKPNYLNELYDIGIEINVLARVQKTNDALIPGYRQASVDRIMEILKDGGFNEAAEYLDKKVR